MGPLDDYVHKAVPFKFDGAELRFDLSQSLFSSFDIDVGSRLLLKTVARDPALAAARSVLDEGCGVGTLGLCVAKAFPGAEVLLRDRDGLAVAFAERNRLSNKLKGDPGWAGPDEAQPSQPARPARAAPRVERGLIGSGLEGRSFDFVLSNLPAKAGAPILSLFFDRLSGRRGGALLAAGGRAAVVVVRPLAEAARRWIAEAGLEIVGGARGGMHEVFVLERGEAPPEPLPDAPPPGPYLRCESTFKLAGARYRVCGFWGLPEFDTPGYGSSAAAELASRLPSLRRAALVDALFIEPGAGHLAVWGALELGLRRITASSRDLLALEATAWNLGLQAQRLEQLQGGRSDVDYRPLDPFSDPPPAESSFDLVAERLDSSGAPGGRDWPAAAWETASRVLRAGGFYLVTCSPTEETRLERGRPGSRGWSLVGRRRKKGFVATAWRKG